MEILQYDEFRTEKLVDLISSRSSFEVVGISEKMGSTVRVLEATIESAGLKCRVYTRGRIAAAGATFIGGATGVAGLVYAATIAAHNLATYNPDYEIVKHVVDNSISVLYKK
ncbi:hypothetical protein MNZ22_11880 [Aeromonas encheleia]|uniref:hypothetical protein n=1 Tax=Aeromonas encheleia TaxID=73010 RepID=UPI001F5AB555|nr:hypothetical protein [Aeromonas encheleia]UNP87533.1 hypothetical protein MNZ22_11880 [Aeromonas encheleia]